MNSKPDKVKKKASMFSKNKREPKEPKLKEPKDKIEKESPTDNENEITDEKLDELFEKFLIDVNIPEASRDGLRKRERKVKLSMIHSNRKVAKNDTAEHCINLLRQFCQQNLTLETKTRHLDEIRIFMQNSPVSTIKEFDSETNHGFDLLIGVIASVREIPDLMGLCLRSLRAFGNFGYGLFALIKHHEALTHIASCLNHQQGSSMMIALEILTLIAFYSREGHRNVLLALFNANRFQNVPRFEPIIRGVENYHSEDINEPESLSLSCIQFINVLTNPVFANNDPPLDYYFRMHLRREFVSHNLLQIYDAIIRDKDHSNLHEEVEKFFSDYENDEEEYTDDSTKIIRAFAESEDIFRLINRTLTDEQSKMSFQSILSSLLIIKDDPLRTDIFKFLDNIISEIILQPDDFCPDPTLRRFTDINMQKFINTEEYKTKIKELEDDKERVDRKLTEMEMQNEQLKEQLKKVPPEETAFEKAKEILKTSENSPFVKMKSSSVAIQTDELNFGIVKPCNHLGDNGLLPFGDGPPPPGGGPPPPPPGGGPPPPPGGGPPPPPGGGPPPPPGGGPPPPPGGGPPLPPGGGPPPPPGGCPPLPPGGGPPPPPGGCPPLPPGGGCPPLPPGGGPPGPPGMGGPPPPPGFRPPAQINPNEEVFSKFHLNRIKYEKPASKDTPALKKANWNKINTKKVTSNSVWAQIKDDALPEDILDLWTANFATKVVATKVPEQNAAGPTSKPNANVKMPIILDGKSAQNIAIMSAALRLDYVKLSAAILEVNTGIITASVIERISKALPENEVLTNVSKLTDPPYEELVDAEKFCYQLGKIKKLKPRLDAILFSLKFEEKVEEIKTHLFDAQQALDQIRHSEKFLKILEVVLSLGNFMNTGGRNAQSIGFEIEYLAKLVNTKDVSNKKTLLNYLVDIVDKKHFPAKQLLDELASVQKAKNFSLDNATSNVQEIKKEVKGLDNLLKGMKPNKNKDESVPDLFQEKMMPFLEKSKEQISLMDGFLKKLKDGYNSVCEYLTLDDNKYKIEDLFRDINEFIEQYKIAIVSNEDAKVKEARERKNQEDKERRDRERKAAANASISKLSGAKEDDGGVMDNLLQMLKKGDAYGGEKMTRTKRAAGYAQRQRMQMANSRTREVAANA